MKKKTLLVLLTVISLIAAMALSACGGSSGSNEGSTEGSTDTEAASEEAADGTAESAEGEAAAADTLQSRIEADPEYAKELRNSGGDGLTIDFSGNDIIYTYDLKSLDVTAEQIADENMISGLNEGLENQKDVFVNIASEFESDTGLSGIQVIVRYIYEDQVIVERVFTSAG